MYGDHTIWQFTIIYVKRIVASKGQAASKALQSFLYVQLHGNFNHKNKQT